MHGAGIPRNSGMLSLDGQWKFRLFASPEEIPAEVFDPGCGDTDWRTVEVPSNWTLQDTSDTPVYTNVQMPFANTPPIVPEENPSGIYRRKFTLPETWRGRRVVLYVGGAESYLEVYCNGRFIGMSKDTRLASEFDLTAALTSGENTLVCKVIRWSDSSYIEDQDQWWMAGIYRSVCLYSTANVWLEDFCSNGDWDYEKKQGVIDIACHLGFYLPEWGTGNGPEENYSVFCRITDENGAEKLVLAGEIDSSFRKSEYKVELHAAVPDVLPWSSEEPRLYTLQISLLDHGGNLLDQREHKVGFRNIRFEGQNLLINGKRVMICGVNRHEHDPETGKTLSAASMLQDIRLLKQFNFNAVRTSHYPNDPRWYDLCDEYGIYLIDEANFEAHANYKTICRDPRWKKAVVDRAERMVLRDRSHVSVIGWSLGNESGHGENHLAAAAAVKALDKTRFIFHEGELKSGWEQGSRNASSGGDHSINAIYNPMYTSVNGMEEFARDPLSTRPGILSEYAHAMGNSSGSLSDYWELFYSCKGLQGGFIWDWVDQGLLKKSGDGREFYAYGGDFGEKIHDFDFCCNGMLASDRTPRPAMYEFRYLVRPVRVCHLGGFRFRLENRRNFTCLNDLAGTWSVEINGLEVRTGMLDFFDSLAPESSLEFSLPLEDLAAEAGDFTFINFAFCLKESCKWGEKGTLMAHDQHSLSGVVKPAKSKKNGTAAPAGRKLFCTNNGWVLQSNSFRFSISMDGSAKELSLNGKVVMENAFDCNIFRAPTDNDGIKGWTGQDGKPMGQWLAAGLDKIKAELVKIVPDEKNYALTLHYILKTKCGEVSFIQCIWADEGGAFTFSMDYRLPDEMPSLPRIGVIGMTAPGFENYTYFGKGPWENYIDRCASAQTGRYSSTVSVNCASNYVMPQENGNRTGTKELTLKSDFCELTVYGDDFEFGVSRYTPEELFKALHWHELIPHRETVVTLDLVQRGLGTGSCGPQTLTQYEINGKQYNFTFKVTGEEVK